MKHEEGLLKLICLVAAAGFLVLVGYNLVAAGAIISTDGLFLTVVPLVLALTFLFVPAREALARRLEKRQLHTTSGARQIAPGRRTVPALTDAKGRPLPPDVNRIVAELKAPSAKENK